MSMANIIPAADKVALGLIKYTRPMPIPKNRVMSEQMEEYYGIGSFHCPEHQKLAEKLLITTKAYSQSRSLAEKQQIAKAELELWLNYVKARTEVLPDYYKMQPKTQSSLLRHYTKNLFRREDSIACDRMLDFHSTFIEDYPFDVPIDMKSLHEMLHPHAYYLCSMPTGFTFAQLLQFYNLQSLASYERSLGEDILARQLSALNYWRFLDEDLSGILNKKGFQAIMKTLRFPILESLSEIQKEFSWTLKDLPNEFEGMSDENFFIRFQLIRKLFLDHNL
ncbi:unnamed protein product [Blepharisma stoltei]|uniref:EF-hand domain-containing protein n=1 Tax=Blepharisma stoltei TaxID=1481888 RepID=A0AAU9KGS0_9CILI|nr:unnamed protein product [Blepharisma stoltei]